MEPAEQDDVQTLCQMVLAQGACAARIVDPSEVVTGDWVRLKCQYRCSEYNHSLTCPPFAPDPSVTRKILSHYSTALLFELPEAWQAAAQLCMAAESLATQMGFRGATVMGAGPCSFSPRRSSPDKCGHPEQQRPSMQACGIDVRATAEHAGFFARVGQHHDCIPSRFGLLLVV